MHPSSSRPHFPGLNGIRAVAALMVFIHHVELYKLSAGLPNRYLSPHFHPWLAQFGSQGVGIFFVLSGFLITHLLLEEKERAGRIRVLSFYARRVLRIWPVYFLVVSLGFFILPLFWYPDCFHVRLHPYFGIKLALYVFFLPGAVLSVFGVIYPMGPLWSVGVEEQFYLFWPQLLGRVRNTARALIIFIAACTLIRLAAQAVESQLAAYPLVKLFCKAVFDDIRFGSMAMGGLAACLLRQSHFTLAVLFRRSTQAAMWIAVAVLFGLNPPLGAFQDLVYGGLYAVIILNVAANPEGLLKPTHGWLDALGKVSYGFYMYHTPLLFGLLYGLKPYANAAWFSPFVYGIGLASTWCAAAFSYRYFESPILARKNRIPAGAD